MMKDLVIIGAGGHCRSVIDVVESTGAYRICAIVDLPEKRGVEVLPGYKVSHSDSDFPTLFRQFKSFTVAIGQVKSAHHRLKYYDLIKGAHCDLPVIISPHARVSKYSKIGEGTVIFHNAVINANVEVGVNCILNTQSLLEHDVVVGDHCHISTGCVLNGGVRVGNGVFVGSQSVIREGLAIADNSIVPAGTVMLRQGLA